MDQRPRCPKCGEPARKAIGTAVVEVVLEETGKPGRILRAQDFTADPRYVCGGDHEWTLITMT